MMRLAAIGIASALLLSGCAGFSGLDADSKFSCKAPDGVTCMSVSGIYANSKANNLPGLRKRSDMTGEVQMTDSPVRSSVESYNPLEKVPSGSATTAKTSPRNLTAPSSGEALRTPERILRVWLAPFEDQDGDLHDQKYFYVMVTPGQWTLEANRANIRSKFQQIRPLSRNNQANKRADGEDKTTPQQQAQQVMPVSSVQQSNSDDNPSQ